ncbi:D-alanyl-D-alanine carboxypeptidase/D-alanyl-D-alanine-endopeptidase [Mucilaginibacter sp. RS28]|uniref:D-alanyl-D-alanine carboxypeptidase/D-alanyl-D-alanine-endopeptidase n=1 Tax=Mucilaginibacter straminoryzae TaxID=2932774 RepID=A0A9X1X807_9SPHI|nr:D-alanyl-D-alanine carboxypeptidase/D-alanyl-D-alanine-endopeptidase [Mucilaginibacter straminoryzae]MCJ8210289.1 D-alanyl-D-alanine carboxypeptidase/D-alanyl-D-alanine-endopeptidase [Mucilaginibacter straminoryzae]
MRHLLSEVLDTPLFKIAPVTKRTSISLSRGVSTGIATLLKRTLGCVLFVILLSGTAFAQSLTQNLQSAFTRLQQDAQSTYASVSLTVLDAKTGEVVFTANPNMGLATASTMKTITTITAMNILGPDYRFKTTLGGDGSLGADGTYNGNIIINAGNDPTLASFRWEETKESFVLNEFVNAIKKAGIKKITGKIIAMGINHEPDGWIWADMGNYYGAFPNNLCWRENAYDILLRPTQPGKPVTFAGTVPAMPYLKFYNELTTGAAGSGDNANAHLPVNSNNVFLQGTYAIDEQKHKISAALPDPPYEAARRLKDTLEKAGITVSGGAMSETINVTQNNNANIHMGQTFVTHQSPPLKKVIYWLNQKSINLYAEQLMLAMGDSLKTDDYTSVVKNFWKGRGIDVNSLNMKDGSGLSPGNRVTTMTMAKILQSARKETWFPDFFASLPVYNNMHMKSGYINNVLAYAGYQTHQGRELCFSIIINNFNGSTSAIRPKLFKVLDELK